MASPEGMLTQGDQLEMPCFGVLSIFSVRVQVSYSGGKKFHNCCFESFVLRYEQHLRGVCRLDTLYSSKSSAPNIFKARHHKQRPQVSACLVSQPVYLHMCHYVWLWATAAGGYCP